MFNRWLSFYDPVLVELSNELNKQSLQIPDKQLSYDFLYTVVPKLRYKRIKYIKKAKAKAKRKADIQREESIALLANANELSQREVRMYLEMEGHLD